MKWVKYSLIAVGLVLNPLFLLDRSFDYLINLAIDLAILGSAPAFSDTSRQRSKKINQQMSSLSCSEILATEGSLFLPELNKKVSVLSIMMASQDEFESELGDQQCSLSLLRLLSRDFSSSIFSCELSSRLSSSSLIALWGDQYLSELRYLRSSSCGLSCKTSGEYFIDEMLSSLPASTLSSRTYPLCFAGGSGTSFSLLTRAVLLIQLSLWLFMICFFLLLSSVWLSKFLARLSPFHKLVLVCLTCLIQWFIHFEIRSIYYWSPHYYYTASISLLSLFCKYSSRSLSALSRIQRFTTEMSLQEEKSFFDELLSLNFDLLYAYTLVLSFY